MMKVDWLENDLTKNWGTIFYCLWDADFDFLLLVSLFRLSQWMTKRLSYCKYRLMLTIAFHHTNAIQLNVPSVLTDNNVMTNTRFRCDYLILMYFIFRFNEWKFFVYAFNEITIIYLIFTTLASKYMHL